MIFSRASATAIAAAALLAGHTAAKTDLAGCVSSLTVAYGGGSLIWYVPDTGEVCEFLDCGGGRAPPKTTVPGCAAYEGTATYSPRYLSGFGASATPTASSSSSSSSAAAAVGVETAEESSASTSPDASITSPPVTILTGTAASSTAAGTRADSDSDSGSVATSASSSSTSNVSTAGAVLPTAAVKGGFGIVAGLAVGVAML